MHVRVCAFWKSNTQLLQMYHTTDHIDWYNSNFNTHGTHTLPHTHTLTLSVYASSHAVGDIEPYHPPAPEGAFRCFEVEAKVVQKNTSKTNTHQKQAMRWTQSGLTHSLSLSLSFSPANTRRCTQMESQTQIAAKQSAEWRLLGNVCVRLVCPLNLLPFLLG